MININTILYLLQNIYLQTGNPFVDGFNNLFGIRPSQVGGTVVVAPDWIPLVSFAIIGLFILLIARYFVNGRRKPNDEEPIGIIEFVVRKMGRFEGFVNQYNAPMKPSYLRALKASTKLTDKGIDKIIALREQGFLYFYQMYYRDTRDLIVSTVKRRTIPALIISTAPLDDKKYATVQSEAKWSWVSFNWDYVKTCICNSASEKTYVETNSGETMDVWILAPEPDTDAGSQLVRSGEKRTKLEVVKYLDWQMDLKEIKMEVNILPYDEDIAKIASSLVLASDQINFINNLKERLATLVYELSVAHNKINSLKRINDNLKLLAGQKPLVQLGLPQIVSKVQDYLVWIMFAGFASIMGTQLPTYVPQLSNMNPLLGGGLGMVAIIAIYMVFGRSKEDDDEQTPDERLIQQ